MASRTLEEDIDPLGAFNRYERASLDRQIKLLMKLNRNELIVLAKHYQIKGLQYYTAPGDWKFGGKEELCGEIAERMESWGH